MNKRSLLCAGLGLALAGAISAANAVLAQSAPHQVEVTVRRFTFEPTELRVKKGEPVVLVLRSLDVAHGLRFRDLNIETKVSKGGTSEVRFTPDKVGDFVGHCAVFCGSGHGGMSLTIHVTE
jgi:cytochrome c oxidase subunit 2